MVAFTSTGTNGTLIAIATGQSKNVPVLSTGTFTIGELVIAIATAGLVGPSATAPTIPVVGVSRSAATTTAQLINVDLNIPTLP